MSTQFFGEIKMVAFTFAPRDWAFCSGQIMAISQNQTLFSLLGDFYGGDGRTSFGLPDLRARTPVGSVNMGQPPGLTPYALGQRPGLQFHTISQHELPTHNHAAVFAPSGGSTTVNVLVSTENAKVTVPGAGDYLAVVGDGGRSPTQQAAYVAPADAGTTVPLGGVVVTGGESGDVTVGNTGDSSPMSLLNPMTAINFVIAMSGLYPPRN